MWQHLAEDAEKATTARQSQPQFCVNNISISDIYFDEQDANLFLVEDAQLRADALKHSVLPRLQIVLNEAIALVRQIYGVEALVDSIVSKYPNFRTGGTSDIGFQYDSAFVGLGGQRKARWPGVTRKDGKEVQILPFRYAFVLTQSGVFTLLENGWLTGLSGASFKTLLDVYGDNEAVINPLCFFSGIRPEVRFNEKLSLLSSMSAHHKFCKENAVYDNHFVGHNYHFPIRQIQLLELISAYATFYPVYDAYIQLAKGAPSRLTQMIEKLNTWMQNSADTSEVNAIASVVVHPAIGVSASLAAQQKIRVMPSIRWQVFQRDQWKCVSCGRNSHHDAILHVDHIIPRSRGGADALMNYQTLCDVCNLGKGNRDSTDLRK